MPARFLRYGIMQIRIVLIAILSLASAALLSGDYMSKMAANPAYDKIKTLVGSWKGAADEHGQQLPTKVRFKMVSDGSAIASWLDEDTPHEMLTMFHLDGDEVVATHYCAAHNQPRMLLVKGGEPNKLVFKFKDGTNIAPGDGHMQQLTITFDGPNHHTEDWTYNSGGKEDTTRFDFKRE